MNQEAAAEYQHCQKSRTWIWLGCAVAVAVVVSGIVHQQAGVHAVRQAEEQIQGLLLHHKAIHLYIQRDAHPAFYRAKDEGEIKRGFYSPEFLSSSFMVRNIHAYLNEVRKEDGFPELYYKMAATNPRNPVNVADASEQELIAMFRADREMTEYRDIVEVEGAKYLRYARPVLATNEACLKCHGDSEAAPRQLQARYEGAGGFGDQVGNIRAIESIRAPIEGELAAAQIICIAVLIAGFGISALLFINRGLVSRVRARTRPLEQENAERRRVEEALRKSERRFRDIVETGLQWIWEVDAEGRYTYVSPIVEKILGYAPEEVLGTHFHDWFHPEDREELKKAGFRVFAQKQPFREFANRNVHKNGRTRWLLTSGVPMLDERGGHLGYRGASTDMTERKRAEEELCKNMAELEQFNALAIGREERMIELKRQVNEMARKAGEPPPYDLSFLEGDGGFSEERGPCYTAAAAQSDNCSAPSKSDRTTGRQR